MVFLAIPFQLNWVCPVQHSQIFFTENQECCTSETGFRASEKKIESLKGIGGKMGTPAKIHTQEFSIMRRVLNH